MGQDMSDSFGSIGEILEAILVDEHENLDSSDRAKTHILMNKFSGQRAPFRDFVMESHLKYKTSFFTQKWLMQNRLRYLRSMVIAIQLQNMLFNQMFPLNKDLT